MNCIFFSLERISLTMHQGIKYDKPACPLMMKNINAILIKYSTNGQGCYHLRKLNVADDFPIHTMDNNHKQQKAASNMHISTPFRCSNPCA